MRVGRVLDEHVRGQIVQIPVRGNAQTVCQLSSYEGLHPFLGGGRIVDLGPGVLVSRVERLTVVRLGGMVVFDSFVKEDLDSLFRGFPPIVVSPCSIVPQERETYQGATDPTGGLPQKSVSCYNRPDERIRS